MMETLLDFEAQADIRDLNSHYARCVDAFRLDETVACWTPDGVFDERENGLNLYVGADAIRDLFANVLFPQLSALTHLMANHVLWTGSDGIIGSVDVLCEAVRRDGGRSRVWSRYEDRYRMTPMGWRFASRKIRATFPREPVKTP